MAVKVWTIDKKAEKYEKIVLKKARLMASFLSLDGRIEIFLVGNRQMKKNVLSYVAKDMKSEFPYPDSKDKYLGEIYLNPFYINRRKESLLFMLVHGLLHIAGYDHKRKNDRMVMERKEEELVEKFLRSRLEREDV